ncbi:Rrf2 family transcriptional regulator [Ferruginibacter sp. HRS2-29]|uniref:RrF2 family transcriptional regulator n=1 Tax=Ferruginibacter sp. HRS2-29 TaxID=2487334 RepID=UPI0020CDADCB|nr:Rrf2 family transcriptional regulator [Ferruginibacter sp. HRS2-29]MCP9752523.1 Rrf2 family transcriptional regulator [Ferruginibacter sp. HRS2-29]
MNNVRFATSIHILTLLSVAKDEYLSSEYIAGSVNLNAAIIRKELSNLRGHGLVESREGKGGGSTLAKPASKILLSDIYEAVRQSSLLGRSNQPNPACPIGKQINKQIDMVYDEAEAALVKQLSRQSLARFIKKFG